MTSTSPNPSRESAGQASETTKSLGSKRSTPARAALYVLRQIPTLLVLAALVGVAYWGHHTGWKAPTFAQLTGASHETAKEDWCVEHGVPDSICLACHPELGGASAADWCKEHGVPESKCTVCHPEILTTGVAGDWCKEHGVPESGCTYCHAEIAVKGSLPPSAEVTLVSEPGGTPTTQPQAAKPNEPQLGFAEPLMARNGKDPKTCQSHARRVQFASLESIQKSGLKLAMAEERPVSSTISVNAEVDYDHTRFAQLSSPVAGKVYRVEKAVGQPVSKGEVVALIDSADVGRAKSELLQAVASLGAAEKTLKRVKTAAEGGLKTEAEVQEAEAQVNTATVATFNAQQALINLGLPIRREDLGQLGASENVRFLGLPETVVQRLDPATTTANLIPILAPFDGVVIDHSLVAGQVIEASQMLVDVADPTRLWVTMDLPLAEAKRIRLGQEITFQPDDARDQNVRGTVSWISTSVDDQTRTVRARAEVSNADGSLLAKTFGQAQVVIRQAPKAVMVPNDAVQWEGCCYVAFVRLSDTVFQTRKLRIGARNNGYTEVMIGVLPGEVLAAAGSHVLKSEILKANLGAGCTDD